MKNILKKEQGITLVALVTTIIILLILSGITIGTLTNKKGLINEANQNLEAAQKESIIEKIEADLYSFETATGKTPTRNKLVEIAQKYGNTDEEKIKVENTDYAINFEEIEGWTERYVNEAKEHGTVFKKNTLLEDSLGNTLIVPKGFKVSGDSAEKITEGIVIEDVKYENTKGSEFVWIPVGIPKKSSPSEKILLGRYTFITDSTSGENRGKLNKEICKFDGSPLIPQSYVSKFTEESYRETGTQNAVAKNIDEFISKTNSAGGFWIGRYEARKKTLNGVINVTEVANDYLYYNITQPDAAQLSRNMYNSDSFESDLINSFAWDTATLFLQEYDNRTDAVKGNTEYYKSRYSVQTRLSPGLKVKGTNAPGIEESKKDKICNVYDMADGCFEWTTETSSRENRPCVRRGGNYDNDVGYTSNRDGYTTSTSSPGVSFRLILYIK